MGKLFEYAQRKRAEEAAAARGFAPKGFDMHLADIISEFGLDTEQIKDLGEKTANRQIANAKVGRTVYYRRATIERLYGKQAQN